MWHTSRGDRTLRTSEAKLISMALDTMLDALLVHLDEEDDSFVAPECQSGITVYDSLTVSQRVSLIYDVARYLLTDTKSTMPLSAVAEAAVAAIFVEIRDQVAIEIDLFHEQHDAPEQLSWRTLVLDAHRSLYLLRGPLRDDGFEDSMTDGASRMRDQILRFHEDSEDLKYWESLIEELTDAILWDRDFELAESFLDVDPGVSQKRRRMLGIDNDYFTFVAPDPRPEQVMRLVWSTRDIVRTKPR